MIHFSAAVLAAYSNFPRQGFRQKDVRFYIDLFLNWTDATKKPAAPAVHNTQVMRLLEELCQNGFARKRGGQRPVYTLTRPGVIDLASQLAQSPRGAPFDDFIFAVYFVRSYGRRLIDLVGEMDQIFPKSLQMELEAVLDVKSMLQKQVRYLDLEIERLKLRVSETTQAAELAERLQRQGSSLPDIIHQVSEKYPYELNYYKPMNELLMDLPNEIKSWELVEGNRHRARFLWQNYLNYLTLYREMMRDL